MVLSALEYYDYSVYESVGVNNAKKLHERGIKYLASDEQKERKYVPFENGCIHEEDKNYIIENKITAHEIARYTDGWYSCFPYPELFKTYDKNELKLNYLSILHTAMFARVLDREYIGDWHRLIGNILCFLKICDVEIKWEKLYEIFRKFLEVSLIYISQ